MRSTLCLLTVQGGIPNPPLINHRTHLCFRSLGSAALAPAGAIPAGSAASDQGLDSSQPHPLSLGCCGSQGHKIRAVFTAFDIPTCPPLSRSWQKKPAWNSEICCHPLLNFVSSLTNPLIFRFSVQKPWCKMHHRCISGQFWFWEESELSWSARMPSRTDIQAPGRGVSLGKKFKKKKETKWCQPCLFRWQALEGKGMSLLECAFTFELK